MVVEARVWRVCVLRAVRDWRRGGGRLVVPAGLWEVVSADRRGCGK